MENYYEILGVTPHADKNKIKKAFHELAKKYHPDSALSKEITDAEEKFRLIKEAYETLIDDKSRKNYDKYIFKKLVLSSLAKGEDTTYVKRAVDYYEYGRKAYKTKKFLSASKAFQSAINLDPDNPLYCSWLGITLSQIQGKIYDAKKWCEKAVRLVPDNVDYLVNLAIVCRDAGLKSLSEKYLKDALRLDPNNKRALLWSEGKNKKFSFKNLLNSILKIKR